LLNNILKNEFIDTGKLKVTFRDGRMFVTDQSIKECIEENSLVKNSQLTF